MISVELASQLSTELAPKSENLFPPLINQFNQLLIFARVPDEAIQQVVELADKQPSLAKILNDANPNTIGLFTAIGMAAGAITGAWIAHSRREAGLKADDGDEVAVGTVGAFLGGVLGAAVDSKVSLG